jgi:hypothetical protein
MQALNVFTKTTLAVSAAAAALAFAPSAEAFSVSGSGGITGSYLGNSCTAGCTDFASAGYTVSGGAVGTKDAYGTIALKPGSDSGSEDFVSSYNITSVKPKPFSTANTAINISGLSNAFSFYWGSVDTHNVVEFLSTGSVVGTITGFSLADALGWDQTPNEYGNYAKDALLSFSGGTFDAVRLSVSKNAPTPLGLAGEQNGIAFESAATPVPEPGTLLMLGGSLFMASQLKRRQAAQ